MKRLLSTSVATICLLALFVSSAACLVATPTNNPGATHVHMDASLSAPQHACCPKARGSGEHASATCCTVHHQAVAAVSVLEIEQPFLSIHLVATASLSRKNQLRLFAETRPTPQLPPLLAIRI